LAYHYGNRRLNFLRSPDLVRLVESLGDHADPRQAFDANGLDSRRWSSFERALRALASSDFLEPVPPSGQTALVANPAATATEPTQADPTPTGDGR
jgi:putative mycofactocin binding protein MftB